MKSIVPMTFAAHLRLALVRGAIATMGPVEKVIEIGSGIGAMAAVLSNEYEYLGFEPDLDSFVRARGRLLGSPNARIVNDFVPDASPPGSHDLLVAFEVLEHIQNDVQELCRWVRWVKPGGSVIISVPAFEKRFSAWDRSVGHFRRYERSDLEKTMRDAGLIGVEVRTYGMPLGYVLEFIRNRFLLDDELKDMPELTSSSGRRSQPNRFSRLRQVLTAPFVLLQKPFVFSDLGTGFVAWGKVPD